MVRPFYANMATSIAMLLLIALLLNPLRIYGQTNQSLSSQESLPENTIITDPQRAFNEANFLLEQQQYTAALDAYHAIEAAGFLSGPLLLNTGLAYVHMQEPGRALFYFERSKGFTQTKSQAERAAEFVRERLHKQFAEPPVLATFIWYERIQFYIGPDYFALLALIFLNLAVLFWVIHWFLASFRRSLRYGALILVLFSLPVAAAALYTWQSESEWERAMVVETGHELREQPNRSSEAILMVYPGFPMLEYASLKDAPEGWSFVHMSNGLQGWLPQESFMRYPPSR